MWLALNRWRSSARMPTATLGIAETLAPFFDVIGLLRNAVAMFCLDGLAEDLIMSLEAIDVMRGLNEELEQVQQCRGVLGLRVERI